MIDLQQIRIGLTQHQPQLLTQQGFRRAAVAMLLREQAGETEVLFIRRAEHELDPWSGDLAFPGGGVDPTDPGPRAAAERETFEEIGLELAPHQYLGRSDDLAGAYLSIHIACFVYQLDREPDFRLNGEVVDLFWVPFRTLLDPARNRLHEFRYRGAGRRHPVIVLPEWSNRPLWGITYRLLQNFLGRFELSFRHPEHF
jgi:8-oxo-dGTP pyrophosphatase MutT (NUDIX family)